MTRTSVIDPNPVGVRYMVKWRTFRGYRYFHQDFTDLDEAIANAHNRDELPEFRDVKLLEIKTTVIEID